MFCTVNLPFFFVEFHWKSEKIKKKNYDEGKLHDISKVRSSSTMMRAERDPSSLNIKTHMHLHITLHVLMEFVFEKTSEIHISQPNMDG